MSGVYSVGKNASDSFSTISSAINALISKGINGNISIKIRGGTYNEQFIIPQINGSQTYTITFKPYDTSAVKVTFSPSSATTNYLVKIDSSSNISLTGIEFTNNSKSFGRIIELSGNNANILIKKNVFNGVDINSTSDVYSIIYSSASHDTSITIDSNTFYNGSDAVVLSGSGNNSVLNSISYNHFFNSYSSAIYSSLQSGISIAYNIISTNSTHTQFIGIELSNCTDENRIEGNQISFNTNGFCILLNRVHSLKGKESIIANNFTHAGGNAAAIGIFIETCSFINLYYNNIYISSKTLTSAGRCINIQDVNGYCGNLDIKNNIIVNNGPGFGLITFTTDTISSDYNCFYTPIGYMGYWNGYLTNTLSTWMFYSKQDTNSLQSDPLYYSANNLHISNNYLFKKGKALQSVLFDIDHELRDSTKTTIGADELKIFSNDLAIIGLSDKFTVCEGDSLPLSIELKNMGIDTIKQFTSLLYIDNKLIDSNIHSSTINPGNKISFIAGSFRFKNKSSFTTIIKIILPNSKADENAANNTFIKIIDIALSDTVHVDQNGNGDYKTINEVFSDIMKRGVCGNVVIQIEPGLYNEQLDLGEFTARQPFLVKIIGKKTQSDSVVVRYNSTNWYANYVFQINNTNNVSIENISFVADGGVYAKVIDLTGTNKNISFISNQFIGQAVTNYSGEYNLVTSTGETISDSAISFIKNSFLNGSYAISFSGRDFSNQSYKLSLKNNTFINQYANAVNVSFYKELVIDNNFISGNTLNQDFTAIGITQCSGKHNINGNNIFLKNNRTGIFFGSSSASPGNESIISNNFINISGTVYGAYALNLDAVQYVKILNNTFQINNNHYISTPVDIKYSSSYLTLKNNIFVNNGGGPVINCYTRNNISSNYNLMYTTGNNFGYYNGARSKFADWVSASGMDNKSINVKPTFYSDSNLHNLTLETDSAATPLSEVLYDIDGEARNQFFPDIGADEYTLNENDANLTGFPSFASKSCDGVKQLIISIQNNGKSNLNSIKLNWWVNGHHYDTLLYFINFRYLNKLNINLGNYLFYADSANNITMKASEPNNKNDQDTSNNTIQITDLKLIKTPDNLQVFNDTLCSGDTAMLSVTSKYAKYYFWYDSSLNNKLVSTDSFYIIPNLTHNKTLFVNAGSELIPNLIQTEFTNQNSNLANGNMFDIVNGKKNIWIDSFDVHTQYNSIYTFLIYTKKGSYWGYQNDSLSWTRIDSLTVKADGFGKTTRLALNHPFFIAANDTVSFYITTYSVGYINFSPVSVSYKNSDFTITAGIALDYLFDATFSSVATWNGKVHYSAEPYCQTSMKTVDAVVREKIKINLPSDTIICSGNPLLIDACNDDKALFGWYALPGGQQLRNTDTITITTAGKYRFVATDICGNTSIDTMEVKYAILPEAFFDVNDSIQCLNQNNFRFTNKSFSLIDKISYHWDLGDSISSIDSNVNYIYQKPGEYKVRLTVKSDKACVDVAEQKIIVLPSPEASFATDTNIYCFSDNQVHFINKSSISAGSIKFYWDFGDSSYSISDNPVHHYKNAYNFLVSLITESDSGCIDTAQQNVLIKPNPFINLGNDTVICANKSILLTAGFNYDRYLWSNDSTQAVIRVDTHHNGLGMKTYWLKVMKEGCESTDTIRITFVVCSSVAENKEFNINVFPNPFDNYIFLNFTDEFLQDFIKIIIYNNQGQKVYTTTVTKSQKPIFIKLPETLTTGLYYLSVFTDTKVFHEKIMKE